VTREVLQEWWGKGGEERGVEGGGGTFQAEGWEWGSWERFWEVLGCGWEGLEGAY
jgi:hypothetical protein